MRKYTDSLFYQLATYSQKLTLTLTVYDPGIPEHTPLTLLGAL